jgi:hypothetical protein
MHIPPLLVSCLSAHLVAPSTTMMNYILHSGGKTQMCTSDPWKLTMKRQVAPPYTISLSVSHLSACLVASSTTMMNYILCSGGKTQVHTSDLQKLKTKRRVAVAPPSTSPPSNSSYILLCPPYNLIDAIICNTKSIGSTRCESMP